MNTIAKPNVKGQVVIPKKVRESLGITPDTFLNIVVRGQGIYMYPLMPDATDAFSYLKILEKTRGAWGKETPEEARARRARRKLELAASRRNKKAW